MNFEDINLTKVYTYADYLTWKFDQTVELIQGSIFKMSHASGRHPQPISTKLLARMEY